MGSIFLGFILYAVITRNFIMATAFILTLGVYFLIDRNHPELVDMNMTTSWIKMKNHFYIYSEIQTYHFIYEHNIKILNIKLKKHFLSELSIHIPNTIDLHDIQTIFTEKGISEDTDKKESFTSIISRIIKL